MNSLLELFVSVDNFWQVFRPYWHQHLLETGARRRLRGHVQQHLQAEFPNLVSYKCFVALKQRIGVPLYVYLHTQMGHCTGISFIDSTPLRVCHNRRIPRHHVFDGWAARGKITMGWFYGFKLHLVVNDLGELIGVRLTPSNVDDRRPVPSLATPLFGKLFGDKGYLSVALRDELRQEGVELITSIRRNMKPQLLTLQDKLLLRCRSIIETINDQLKNISQIQHSRHRSVNNFFVNLIAGLVAYCRQERKPAVYLDPAEYRALATSH